MDISGNKMLHLKQDLAFLRQRLAECSEESAKQSIRREIMKKKKLTIISWQIAKD